MVTSQYEVLEPETWVGKELPILDHIDIGEQLKTGNWLIMLYHYNCPNCAEAIPKIEQMARDMQGNEDVLKFALIEVPPYGSAGSGSVSPNTPCTFGKLDMSKEWFVATPVIVLVQVKNVRQSWKEDVPLFEELINIRFQTKKDLTFLHKFTLK
jgi:hypothetical protein